MPLGRLFLYHKAQWPRARSKRFDKKKFIYPCFHFQKSVRYTFQPNWFCCILGLKAFLRFKFMIRGGFNLPRRFRWFWLFSFLPYHLFHFWKVWFSWLLKISVFRRPWWFTFPAFWTWWETSRWNQSLIGFVIFRETKAKEVYRFVGRGFRFKF